MIYILYAIILHLIFIKSFRYRLLGPPTSDPVLIAELRSKPRFSDDDVNPNDMRGGRFRHMRDYPRPESFLQARGLYPEKFYQSAIFKKDVFAYGQGICDAAFCYYSGLKVQILKHYRSHDIVNCDFCLAYKFLQMGVTALAFATNIQTAWSPRSARVHPTIRAPRLPISVQSLIVDESLNAPRESSVWLYTNLLCFPLSRIFGSFFLPFPFLLLFFLLFFL